MWIKTYIHVHTYIRMYIYIDIRKCIQSLTHRSGLCQYIVLFSKGTQEIAQETEKEPCCGRVGTKRYGSNPG